ncbi:MAG: sugar ABC transporter ATP-binding protein [Acidobacteriota bacterium]|nr:sugar ABC transporter ATP-binding protein [Acidobacteriota bacterium]
MSGAALRATDVHKRFGAVRVLEGTSLEARAGEVHAVLGENGAGKSTLMRILAGVIRADAGQVTLDGEPVVLGSPSAAVAAGIRTVFQELSTIPQLTVAENLLYGSEPSVAGVVRPRRRQAMARALLERFDLGRIDPAAAVSELGLGDRQLLEVVKALREPPRVLILDEATSALSATDSAWVLAQGRAAAEAGAVVLLITHRLPEVRATADRITVLRSGEAVLTGTEDELEDDALIAAMLGRRVEVLYPSRQAPSEERVLSVEGLTAPGLPGPIALDVSRGEILGIGGLQGQGQRELLMALAGAQPWTGGAASLLGESYAPRSPREALRRGVAYVPEDRQREGLFLGHSVQSNITISSLGRFVRYGLLDTLAELQAAQKGAVTVDIGRDRLGAKVSTLSGGNQQKVVLAKVLLDEPTVLLLHDCTRGVDVGTKADIFKLMARLAAAGTAILFYSSDLSELVHICDRVAVIAEGRLGAVIPREELTEDAILRVAVRQTAGERGRLAA